MNPAPDIKVESHYAIPYSILYGLTVGGEEELKLHHLPSAGQAGGWIVCNLKMLDLIQEMGDKGLITK